MSGAFEEKWGLEDTHEETLENEIDAEGAHEGTVAEEEGVNTYVDGGDPTEAEGAEEPTEGEGEVAVVVVPNSSSDFLNHVWELHGEDERFAIIGGSFSDESVVQDMAGAFSIADPEEVNAMLALPTAEIDKVVNAASIQHMMNTNTFTCSAYELAEGVDTQALADAVKAELDARQWMCGFPDKYIISATDTHFVIMFGAAEIVDNFEAKLEAHDANVTVIYNENLA